MKIGIIGTGAIGSTIAKKMTAAGHEVKVTNSDEMAALAIKAKELGAQPASINDVVKDVEVIIISVPTVAIPQLPKDLFSGVSNDVVVVDTSNYYPFRDSEIEELKNGKGKAPGEEGRIAMAISGDDQNAKAVVAQLINNAGYNAVDAGSLDESWRHQPGTPAYCTELNVNELQEALADGLKEEAPGLRDLAIGKFMERTTPPSHEDVVALNRSLFLKNPKRV
jgi:8-hydroxy-5-deazaflavin:NADPH oxidoreductase